MDNQIVFPNGKIVTFKQSPTPQDLQEVAGKLKTTVPTSYDFAMGKASNEKGTLPSAIDQVIAGYKQTAEGAKNPDIWGGLAQIGRGTLNEAAGGLNAILSPVTAALKVGSQLPLVKQTIDLVKKKAIDPTADWVSNFPALQKFMVSHPNADEVAGNLITIGAVLAGGKNAPEATDVLGDAGKTIADAPGKIARKLVPTPPDITETVSTPEDAQAMKSSILEGQKLGQGLQKNTRSLSPTQNIANKFFGDEGTVYKAVEEGRKAAGDKMSEALNTPGVGDQPLDTSARLKEFNDFSAKTKLKAKYSGDKFGDGKIYNNFINDISQLSEKVGGKKGSSPFDVKGYEAPTLQGKTLKAVDEGFLRNWQPQLGDIKDSVLHKAISNFVEGVNEDAKALADTAEEKLGIQGHPYRESNDEYGKFIQSKDSLNAGRGVLNKQTGRYDNATTLGSGITKTSGPAKELFDAIDQQVGSSTKSGGMTFSQEYGLHQFIEDLYTGEKFDTALKKLPSFGFGPASMIYRVLRSITVGATQDPNVIIKKMIDLIDKSQK